MLTGQPQHLSYLDISTGLVGHLHDEFEGRAGALLAHQLVEYVQVDGGAQIVNIGEEAVLTALVNEFLQQTRVTEGIVEVAVTRWVPAEQLD